MVINAQVKGSIIGNSCTQGFFFNYIVGSLVGQSDSSLEKLQTLNPAYWLWDIDRLNLFMFTFYLFKYFSGENTERKARLPTAK